MKHDFNTLHLLWAIRDIPSKAIKSPEKVILYTFLSSTNYQNDLWYNQESLCEMTGLTRNTLKKHLASLEQKKFITIKKPSVHFRAASNHYSLNLEQIMFYSKVDKGSEFDTLSQKKGSNLDKKGSNLDARRGENLTPKKEREERKEEKGKKTASDEASLPLSEAELAMNCLDLPWERRLKHPEYIKYKKDYAEWQEREQNKMEEERLLKKSTFINPVMKQTLDSVLASLKTNSTNH